MTCAAADTAISSAAIAAVAARCSTISKARPAPGSNARSVSPPANARPRRRPWFREVVSNKPGVRVFVVHSEDRLAYEHAQRVKAMGRVRTKLEALAKRVAKG